MARVCWVRIEPTNKHYFFSENLVRVALLEHFPCGEDWVSLLILHSYIFYHYLAFRTRGICFERGFLSGNLTLHIEIVVACISDFMFEAS